MIIAITRAYFKETKTFLQLYFQAFQQQIIIITTLYQLITRLQRWKLEKRSESNRVIIRTGP